MSCPGRAWRQLESWGWSPNCQLNHISAAEWKALFFFGTQEMHLHCGSVLCMCMAGVVVKWNTHTQTSTLGPAIRQQYRSPRLDLHVLSGLHLFHFLSVLVLLSSFASYGVQSVEVGDENVRELGVIDSTTDSNSRNLQGFCLLQVFTHESFSRHILNW